MEDKKMEPDSAVTQLQQVRLIDKHMKERAFDVYLVDMHRVFKEGKEEELLIGVNSVKEMFQSTLGLVSVIFYEMTKIELCKILNKKSSATILFVSKDDDCADHLIAIDSQISRSNGEKMRVDTKKQLFSEFVEAYRKAHSRNPKYKYFSLSDAKENTDFDLIYDSDVSSDSESCQEALSESGESTQHSEIEQGTIKEAESQLVDNSDDEDENNEMDRRYSKGYHAFLASCLARKLKLKELFSQNNRGSQEVFSSVRSMLGPENRLAAVCSFRARRMTNNKRIIYISMMAVRKHHRGLGIGTEILNIIKSPRISGHYDAIVVHADLDATRFYIKNEFSSDPVLNKQWSSIASEYENSLLMTYVPTTSSETSDTSSSDVFVSFDESEDD